MKENTENTRVRRIQEELLGFLPLWNYHITKPFKQLLDEGVSLEMYYSLQVLRLIGDAATMTEFGKYTRMPKQQVTKMVNRLVERNFVERIYDPTNRRIIRIRLTETGEEYIDHFLTENAGCFRNLLEQLTPEECGQFEEAIKTLYEILSRLPLGEQSPEETENLKENLR